MPAAIRKSSTTQSGARGVCLFLFLCTPYNVLAEAAADSRTAGSGTAQSSLLVPSTIDFSSAVVGSISISIDSIFDLDRPDEDRFLYRLANKAHVTTRQNVITQQLLFQEGDLLTRSALEESERILRSNRYIQDANIETVQRDDGSVDVNVHTSDVWTLVPKISLSRSGGENNSGIGIKEMNLLGTGMEVEASYKSDVDRDALIFKFVDQHLFNSWYSLRANYGDNSDGHTYLLDLQKPFYSLDATSAHGFSLLDDDRIDSLYDAGEIQEQFRHRTETFEIFRGWSKGLHDGWTKRYLTGIAYDDHQFSAARNDPAGIPLDPAGNPAVIPDNRTLVYPFVGIDFMQDRFEKTTNVEQVNRTEDRFLGTRITARLGYASTALGADRNAWIVTAGAERGFGSSEANSLILASDLATRMEDDGLQNLTFGLSARYYRRQSERRLFYASLSGIYGHNLDLDNQLLLGGDNGLRGYPLRYQSGDKAALLTLEQRVFTDWYPFRLFRVGGGVFFDAGKTWNSPYNPGHKDELLSDVGFGLRLGNTRSGQGRMTHIDLAFPLDGDPGIKNVQFLIETKKSF